MPVDRLVSRLRRRQEQQPPMPRFLFVVTYGRSGSTLTQGLLNAMPGTLIRGENNFFILPLFRAWADVKTFRQLYGKDGSRGSHSAFYGLDEMSLKDFVITARRLTVRQLLGEHDRADVDVLGFKEVLWHRIAPEETEEFFEYFERVFPQARYVLNRRQHYAVATSGFWREKKMNEVTDAIRRVEEIQDYLRATRPERTLDTRYELLTSEDSDTVRAQLTQLAEFTVGHCDAQLLTRLAETLSVGHGPRPFGRSRIGKLERPEEAQEPSG